MHASVDGDLGQVQADDPVVGGERLLDQLVVQRGRQER